MTRAARARTGLSRPLTTGERVRPDAPGSHVDARRRMSSADRERSIVEAAVAFFTEHGFGGQTRELAATLGITQPLLYRYFPSKEALIERVYQEVFVGRWDPHWEELILEPGRALEDRLIEFYKSYARVIITREWIRLFMFAGLKGLDFNARYLRLLRERIFLKIISQIRADFQRPAIEEIAPTDIEVEMIWGLHASIFYLGVRQFIYDIPLRSKVDDIIEAKIKTLLKGIGSVLPA